MGLIKAALGAVGGTLSDQWLEYFYCDAIPQDVLVVKGQKRVSGRSSNTKGGDNIISNGSGIAVADGQCMIIVEQGKIVDCCSEPGQFTFNTGGEPSLFAGGDLGENIMGSLKSVFERFKYGGSPGKDCRVYYFNTKELMGNKYGTPSPIPFRVVDANIGLDMDISIRCHGEYSYRITNPMLFYTNVCGNITDNYMRSTLDKQFGAEVQTHLQGAFARISEKGVRYSALPAHAAEIAAALNEILSAQWRDLRGIEIVSFGVSSVNADEKDEERIKNLQQITVMRDPTNAAAAIASAQADAMRTAAGNEGGAMVGMMGLGMAQQVGGMNSQNLYAMGQQQGQQPQQSQYNMATDGGFGAAGSQQAPAQGAAAAPEAAESWTCACGHAGNTGKFCAECGLPKPIPAPAEVDGWVCSCGAVNQGKFCAECGKPKPAGVPQYRCDKCGWEPEDKAHPPKFCPQCGDPFDDGDIVGEA
ncbi:MAG: SPFH domain-containing protein [Clostridiales bacterium]|nr:SPFH domain-containing protein [Clostridiales bacterium]